MKIILFTGLCLLLLASGCVIPFTFNNPNTCDNVPKEIKKDYGIISDFEIISGGACTIEFNNGNKIAHTGSTCFDLKKGKRFVSYGWRCEQGKDMFGVIGPHLQELEVRTEFEIESTILTCRTDFIDCSDKYGKPCIECPRQQELEEKTCAQHEDMNTFCRREGFDYWKKGYCWDSIERMGISLGGIEAQPKCLLPSGVGT